MSEIKSIIHLEDDGLCLAMSDGSFEPLYDERHQRVSSFVPGWEAVALDATSGLYKILSFSGPNKQIAAWILNYENCRLGDSLTQLQDNLRFEFLSDCHRTLGPLVSSIFGLQADAASVPKDRHWFSSALYIEVFKELCNNNLPETRKMLVSDVIESSNSQSFEAGRGVIRPDYIKYGFETSLQDRLIATTLDGVLYWPSPFDGRRLACSGGLCLDDFRFCYKFEDVIHDTAFFIVASDHLCSALCVYFPSLGLVVSNDSRSQHLLDTYFPHGIKNHIVAHVSNNSVLINEYLAGNKKALLSIMRKPEDSHIGHQLWNELSGIDQLLKFAAGSCMPYWLLLPKAMYPEIWGDIESLFPELSGYISRDVESYAGLSRYIYNFGYLPVRVTSNYVSNGLRARLLKINSTSNFNDEVSNTISSFGFKNPTIVILGLRVENRTVVDLETFYAGIVESLIDEYDEIIVVFDGHNSLSGNDASGLIIRSHGEGLRSVVSVEAERSVVSAVQRRMGDRSRAVLNTIGREIGMSLAWTMRSTYFISIWGANLAKYRWVCNKPGLVVTSAANLRDRDDLHIYDSKDYMENPTTLSFVDLSWIYDSPTSAQLVPVAPGNPFFFNFRVEMVPFLNQVQDLMRPLIEDARA